MILRKQSRHTKGYSRRLCDYIILGTKKVINNIQQFFFFFNFGNCFVLFGCVEKKDF